jgi:protein tyrosine phosphatase (PTP) superfamily phosphohydrolase (DUF442 family)
MIRLALLLLTATLVNAGERPATWARPVAVDGAPNLHQVSKDLYRGAQPNRAGMAGLEKAGVRTVLNLRSFNSDRGELEGTRLGYVHLTMKAWHPEYKEAVAFLKLVGDPAKTPVFVHCQHGADRTGTLCAIYRVAVQGWSKEEAVREMTDGGYGFHEVWKNLPDWIADLDIARLRKDAGIPDPPAARP